MVIEGTDSEFDKDVKMSAAEQILKPFFLQSGLDLDAIPPELQAALQEIVMPLYERHVLRGVTPLEIATGASLTFLMAQEVVAQFELGAQMFSPALSQESSAPRQQQIDRYFRTLGAKMCCAKFLQRLTEFGMQKGYDHVMNT